MSEPPPDSELFRRFLIFFIVFFVLAIFAFSVAPAILGAVCLIGALFFLIIYFVKPEGFRKKLLELWEKQQAEKNKSLREETLPTPVPTPVPTPEPIIEPKSQFCGSCGFKLTPNARFCKRCGAEV